jgi:hypothetical protein
MHDLFIVAIPTLAVMFGILLNRQEATAIRGEMSQLRTELRSEMGALRDSIHRDMISLHERVATVEARNSN